jgi:TPR repeat protein
MLARCVTGQISDFDATSGGEEAFRTQPPKNAHLQQLFIPPEPALEAIRWFRRAMSAGTRVEEYLFLYIALESIAKHIPGVTRLPRRDDEGSETELLETPENAGIRYLLSRHPSLPLSAKRTLATTRARIAHGSADLETLERAEANLPVLQRLVADGIALVYGLDPGQFNVLSPSPIRLLAPVLRARYSPGDNPACRWGGLLSDAFKRFSEAAKQGSAEGGASSLNQRLHPTAGES